MASENLNPAVDKYIANTRPFAQPILKHLRGLMHKGCPQVEETIKWSRPFFEYRGAILCNMSGFKEHCSFGFWGTEIGAVLREAKALQPNAMGSLGRITSLDDLPSDKRMLGWIRQAAAMVDCGEYTSPITARRSVVKATKPATTIPTEFAAALKKNRKAASVFSSFSPSCKQEYVAWIADAKRKETRDKRIVTAIEWIGEGKRRNWKYES
jgi:uncharacterized protein YdeI (YjbR/CyaY-like superfamily)